MSISIFQEHIEWALDTHKFDKKALEKALKEELNELISETRYLAVADSYKQFRTEAVDCLFMLNSVSYYCTNKHFKSLSDKDCCTIICLHSLVKWMNFIEVNNIKYGITKCKIQTMNPKENFRYSKVLMLNDTRVYTNELYLILFSLLNFDISLIDPKAFRSMAYSFMKDKLLVNMCRC